MDTQQIADAVERPSVYDLDLAEVGRRLVTVALVSRLLGHASAAGTARDYLAPRRT